MARVQTGEHGCLGSPYYTAREGQLNISTTSKVIVLEAVHWTLQVGNRLSCTRQSTGLSMLAPLVVH